MSRSLLKDRVDKVVTLCNLQSVLEKSIHKLSKGFRQRVGMARVLLHDPDILIMDEPTGGLDPNQIYDVRQLIRELGRNKTILLSTHILQEVEAMADLVILINEGRIAFEGTPAQMTAGGSLEAAFYSMTGKQIFADTPAEIPPDEDIPASPDQAESSGSSVIPVFPPQDQTPTEETK